MFCDYWINNYNWLNHFFVFLNSIFIYCYCFIPFFLSNICRLFAACCGVGVTCRNWHRLNFFFQIDSFSTFPYCCAKISLIFFWCLCELFGLFCNLSVLSPLSERLRICIYLNRKCRLIRKELFQLLIRHSFMLENSIFKQLLNFRSYHTVWQLIDKTLYFCDLFVV